MGHMTINQWAELVLFGKTLHDKTLSPLGLFDTQSEKLRSIDKVFTPGRPAELELQAWNERDKISFPKADTLFVERNRGLILHFFANHELLALELMALVLLRFPDAPAEFRNGIIHTMADEQRHMQFYLSRMKDLGVAFGEIPVNDFFWTSISSMDTPLDFVSRMSLTFEQANLDYALHYSKLFAEAGDAETAIVLDEVYRDEIKHVNHGLQWFQKWKTQSQSDWEAYRSQLIYPLSPSRAKGLSYSEDARRKAGFDENFIAELALFSQSKGRPPVVYFFNPNCESEVAKPPFTQNAPAILENLRSDLAPLVAFLAHPEDIVLVPIKPTAQHLHLLIQAGFKIPEFMEQKNSRQLPIEISNRKISNLTPWGWSPEVSAIFRPLLSQIIPAATHTIELLQPLSFEKNNFKNFYSKTWGALEFQKIWAKISQFASAAICTEDVIGKICVSMESFQNHLNEFSKFGHQKFVMKRCFSSSGRNQQQFSEFPAAQQLLWMKKAFAEDGELLLEPWLQKIADLSVQFKVLPDGRTVPDGITRFLTDPRGQYLGTILGRKIQRTETDLLRFFHTPKTPVPEILNLTAQQFGKILFDKGFIGPAGIDAFIYIDITGNLKLKPFVELNPRNTMGRVALALENRLAPGATGLWLHISQSQLRKTSFASFSELALSLQKSYPVKKIGSGNSGLIQSGIVVTNCPHQSQNILTVLSVGSDLTLCHAPFEKILQ